MFKPCNASGVQTASIATVIYPKTVFCFTCGPNLIDRSSKSRDTPHTVSARSGAGPHPCCIIPLSPVQVWLNKLFLKDCTDDLIRSAVGTKKCGCTFWLLMILHIVGACLVCLQTLGVGGQRGGDIFPPVLTVSFDLVPLAVTAETGSKWLFLSRGFKFEVTVEKVLIAGNLEQQVEVVINGWRVREERAFSRSTEQCAIPTLL